jgi:hypothetical protein
MPKIMLLVNILTLLTLSLFNRGDVHRHIVLAIQFNGLWGALGISRRDNLMNKPVTFASLYDLVTDYTTSYVSKKS